MDLSIIIVTYKSERVIKDCLKSIYENTKGIDFEVIVLDNDSQDKTVEIIKNNFPQVDLVEIEENLGFSKGVNLGIKKSRGEAVLLMNPDMIVLSNTINKSLRHLNSDKDIGILGCKFVYPDYKLQASFGNYPTNFTELLYSTSLYKIFPYGKIIPQNFLSREKYSKTQTVDWVSGGFMMIKRKVIEKIGGLDERFFMYLEDVDYCKRVKMNEFDIVYFPEVKVIHYHMESAKKDYSRAIINEAKSLNLYFKKYKMNTDFLKIFIYLKLLLLISRHYVASLFDKEYKKMLDDHIKALKEIDI